MQHNNVNTTEHRRLFGLSAQNIKPAVIIVTFDIVLVDAVCRQKTFSILPAAALLSSILSLVGESSWQV